MKLLAAAALAAGLLLGVVPAALAQTTASPAAAPAAEYRVGPGDVLRVVVYQNPDLALETRVTDAGLVSYPLLGSLRVAGLTINDLERLIADGLRNGNFVRQPQVTVSLLQVRAHQVSVLGQVNRPGRYPLETADMRLTEVLASAGGVAPAGSDIVVVSGQRGGQAFRAEIDLPTLFATAGSEKDLVLLNGDTVWVDRQPILYIYGEVQRPGPMRLEREMTLLQALATGGGLTLRGTEKGVRVHRKSADGSVTVLTPAMTDKLREGDVVFVRESLF
ncbi:sugar transporter [beta proteobacterium AAP121]|nr:sugar transporter [beta proteobacterium AAP65]KPF93216.1 sugar transporter [beta proteobacterium AAP121]